jgi:hypothetical protein
MILIAPIQPVIRFFSLSEFSYINIRAPALRIFGLSPIALRSFRAMCLAKKSRTNG